MEKNEEKHSGRRKTPQAVLDLAKAEGYERVRRERKQYQGYDVFEVSMKERMCTGYPIYVLYKDGEASITYGAESEKILDYMLK